MLKSLVCKFEAYVEVNPNEEEHLVEVTASGSISSHSGVTNVSIDSIYSIDDDQEVSIKKVSVFDMKRLMELGEDALLVEDSLAIDPESYQEWLLQSENE